MGCPDCGSDAWKLTSLIYKEGLTESESWGFGGGWIGAPGDGAEPVGAGGIGRRRDQTELSKLAAPPVKGPGPTARRFKSSVEVRKKKLYGLALFMTFLTTVLYEESVLLERGREFTGLSEFGIALLGMMSVIFFLSAAGDDWHDPGRKLVRELNGQARLDHEERYQRELRTYANTRMCLRCGAFYVEGEGKVSPNKVVY